MSAFTYSWQSVERGIWEYFNNAFGTVEGVTAFSLRNLPKTLEDEKSFIWRYSQNGGGIPVQRQSRSTIVGGVWLMDAELEAWAIDDATAMLVGGLVMDVTPIAESDGIVGLQRCYPTAYPSREPDTIRLGGTDNAGQEVLCVRLTVPMQVAFGNTERTV